MLTMGLWLSPAMEAPLDVLIGLALLVCARFVARSTHVRASLEHLSAGFGLDASPVAPGASATSLDVPNRGSGAPTSPLSR